MDTPLLIFDIDGTLTASITAHQDCYSAALAAAGIEVPQQFGTFIHHTDRYIYRALYKQQFGTYPEAATQKKFYEDMSERFTNTTFELIAGAKSFILEQLEPSQIPYVFATGSIAQPALRKLALFDMPHMAERLAVSDEYDSREEIVQDALARASQYYGKTSFAQKIIIGDGVWDYQTARNLSMSFLGIGNNPSLQSLLEGKGKTTWQDFTGRTLEDLLHDAHV